MYDKIYLVLSFLKKLKEPLYIPTYVVSAGKKSFDHGEQGEEVKNRK
jgi:hypothetical protein